MSDLISRSKLQFAVKRNQTIMRDGEHYIRLSAVLEKLRIAPAVDAVPVVHARWEDDRMDTKCTACGTAFNDDMFWNHGDFIWLKYCPNCGAKMDGGAE